MTKIIDKLQRMPKDTCITDKRILALFKRLGYIYDYSPWGYLESQKVYYHDNWDDKESIEHEYIEQGKAIKDGAPGSHSNPFKSRDDMWDNVPSSYFEYKGMKFSLNNYHAGCFKPYLHKDK